MTDLVIDTSKEVNTVSLFNETYALNDKYLHTATKPFDFANPQTNQHYFAKVLNYSRYVMGGLGLAANQVGFDFSALSFGNGQDGMVIFNPKITAISEEFVNEKEGCLSFPGLILRIKRPMTIDLTFQDVDGNVINSRYEGLTARVIHHENDHLLGVNFTQLVGKTAIMLAREKQRKLQKKIERRIR